MAELEPAACCTPRRLADCCEPSEKQDCCGEGTRCGCDSEAGSERAGARRAEAESRVRPA